MSIIQSAVLVRDNPNYCPIPNNPTWDCLSYDYNGVHYDVCFESDHYGDHARQFMVDGSWVCPVKSKYHSLDKNNFLTFSECDSLCGDRSFENESISQEFLYNPLGLIRPNYRDGHRSEYWFLKTFLEKEKIEFKKWRY